MFADDFRVTISDQFGEKADEQCRKACEAFVDVMREYPSDEEFETKFVAALPPDEMDDDGLFD